MADGTLQRHFNFPRSALVSALRPGEIVVDFFAGGGGASEALRQALGRDPDVAVNHDHLAIGMHAANHPFTRHMEADVWTVDTLREVAGRPVGWFHASPDCTHFSQAKGGQPRSRATRSLSWVVLKVAGTLVRAGLAPRIISLENVEQILTWGPLVAKRCKATGLLPLVTAADCIDFSVPCPSIFTRKKPLADATMRRITKGLKRYVLDAAEPFIVQCANASANGVATTSQPLGTITAWPKGGMHALVAPTLVQMGYGERAGQSPRSLDIEAPLGAIVGGGVKHAIAAAHLVKFRGDSAGSSATDPMPTITSCAGAKRPAGAAHAMGVITAFLEQANGGYYDGAGNDLRKPAPTICGTSSQQRLVTAHMATLRGTSSAADVADPLHTISAGGEHHAVVQCTLSPEHEAGALRVAAFLIKYYGTAHGVDLAEPLDTVTTRDRLALVTVTIKGTPYVIVDIGLRMLRREELFRAQGFPPDYIIDRTADGTALSISASVRMVGNSVSPPPLAAIARANLDTACVAERIAA